MKISKKFEVLYFKLKDAYPTVIFPLLVAIFVSLIFWPGLMSYDSVHALLGARNGVSDSTWPPMVSYIWRLVDSIYPSPVAMLFSQVSLLLLSTASILYRYMKQKKFLYFSLLSMLAIPVHLGTVSVIWKDVLLAALALATVALTLKLKDAKSKSRVVLLVVLACLMLVVATSVRHNAIFATGFLAIYTSSTLARKLGLNFRKLFTAFFSIVLLSSMVSTKIFLDNYSLPDLRQISGTGEFSKNIMKLDLLGYAKCSGQDLVIGEKHISINEVTSGYDPRHINLSGALTDQIPSGIPLEKAWFEAASSGSPCFLYQKAQNVYYSLGINPGEQFLITAPEVHENPYGYELRYSPWRTAAFAYEYIAQHLFLFRPYFIWILTAAIILWKRKLLTKLKGDLVFIALAALSYAASQFLFGNASDARLLFFTNWTFAMIAAIGVLYRPTDARNLD